MDGNLEAAIASLNKAKEYSTEEELAEIVELLGSLEKIKEEKKSELRSQKPARPPENRIE